MAVTNSRPLRFLSLLALGINGIIGVGVFFVPKELANLAPGFGALAVLVLTTVGILPVVFVYARLAQRFDEDGGPVVYARAALGPLAGFAVGWLAYLSSLASTAAVLTGLSQALWSTYFSNWFQRESLAGSLGPRVLAFSLLLFLGGLCSRGLKVSANAWTALTALKLMPLVLLIIAASFVSTPAPVVSSYPSSWSRALLTALFMFQGFEIVPLIAGRAESATKTIPRAMFAAVACAAGVYFLVLIQAIRLVPTLSTQGLPLVAAADVAGGQGLASIVGIGTSISALGISLGMVAMTPWYLATSAKGQLGWRIDEINSQGVPKRALIMTIVLVSALILSGSLGELLALSSLAVLVQYLSVSLSLAILEKGWPRIAAVLTCGVAVFVATGASLREVLVAVIGLVIGFVIRAFRGAAKTERSGTTTH